MIDPKEYERVHELYQTGDSILHVVMQFMNSTDTRAYRLFAEEILTLPMGTSGPVYQAQIERRCTIEVQKKSLKVWADCNLSGVLEGKTPEEALKHALSALDRLAAGHSYDEESAD